MKILAAFRRWYWQDLPDAMQARMLREVRALRPKRLHARSIFLAPEMFEIRREWPWKDDSYRDLKLENWDYEQR